RFLEAAVGVETADDDVPAGEAAAAAGSAASPSTCMGSLDRGGTVAPPVNGVTVTGAVSCSAVCAFRLFFFVGVVGSTAAAAAAAVAVALDVDDVTGRDCSTLRLRFDPRALRLDTGTTVLEVAVVGDTVLLEERDTMREAAKEEA